MSREDIEEIARVSGEAAAIRLARTLGLDVDDPRAMQQDLTWLRTWRELLQGIIKAAIIAGALAAGGTAGAMFVTGARITLGH